MDRFCSSNRRFSPLSRAIQEAPPNGFAEHNALMEIGLEPQTPASKLHAIESKDKIICRHPSLSSFSPKCRINARTTASRAPGHGSIASNITDRIRAQSFSDRSTAAGGNKRCGRKTTPSSRFITLAK
jgi:hypothetical protein